MKRIYALLLITVAFIGLSSCDDDLGIVDKGQPLTLTIDASTSFSGVESRAVFTQEEERNGVGEKFILLVYNGTGADAVLQDALDIKQLPATVTLAGSPGTSTYRAIMIANSSLSESGFANCKTPGVSKLKDLNNATFGVSSHYNTPGNTDNTPANTVDPAASVNFTWSGHKDFTGSDRNLRFDLNPNMARLKVTVINNTQNNIDPNDKINVVNLQIKNLRDKVLHAQNALSDCGLYSQDPNDVGVVNYNIEELTLDAGKSETRYYYLAHNEVNKGSYSRPNAPANATYIEVDGVRQSDFMDVAYKIYLGTGNMNSSSFDGNYNILSNNQYNVTITITQDGISYNSSTGVNYGDNNAISPEKIKLPAGNNCYMIHPKISNKSGGIVYELPIHQQINRFWGHKIWYVKNGVNEANEINDNTEWIAEVVWQDQNARVIHFCDENGSYSNNTHNSYNGIGQKPLYFKLDTETMKVGITSPNKDIYGNVLIGIRKKGSTVANDGYLWSYHLWITDYNPDAIPSPNVTSKSPYDNSDCNGLYVQNYGNIDVDIQGYLWYDGSSLTYYSNVQHYNHIHSHYWGTSSAPSASAKVWDGSGIYANKWIMDRNLGAQAPNNIDMTHPIEGFGLYYQFGRKDPFSYKTVYDITGATKVAHGSYNQWEPVSGGTLSNGVLRPYRFYINSSTSWASDATTQGNDGWKNWYSLTTIRKGEKSIFDPCPPGWCVPVADTFDFALNSYNTSGIYQYGMADSYLKELRATASVYFDTDINGDGRLRNMAIISSVGYVNGSNLEGLDATFPLQGNIAGETGNLVNIGVNFSDYGCIWTSETSDSNYGTLYRFQAASGAQSSIYNDKRPSGRTVNRYSGPVVHKNSWIASRGQNVRCIQEPYAD